MIRIFQFLSKDIYKKNFYLPIIFLISIQTNLRDFIKTTETERQDMYDNPANFVALALDTCDKQKSFIVKT